ncbi:MAG: FAD-binding oxidoreductase, partial [Hyphomicrobiales bacterium]
LVGGSVPRGGQVVLQLGRLRDLGVVDEQVGQVIAGAGVTLEALQEHVAASGFAFGVDMASRGSATVGGMVATNAGGMHVLRYGSMRSQVLGLEAVLADGSVVSRMSGLAKDQAGYDLVPLLCGSEGTLAIVTRTLLRLVPREPYAAVVLLGLANLDQALLAVATARRSVPGLQAAEVFFGDGLELVCEHAQLSPPFATRPPVHLLLEAAGRTDPLAELAGVLDGLAFEFESAVASEPAERARLWAYRERHTESINAAGVPHKLDVSVPLARVPAFEAELRALLAKEAPEARLVLFGHLAEGNFHVNLLGLPPDDERVDELVLRLVASFDGSISSEHGVGQAKVRWLHLSRSPAEIAAMHAIKQALDPAGILNPGVMLPAANGSGG